jgi:drug/metabolite transporter (DMT)-like permease
MDAKQLKWAYLLVLSLIWGSSFILIKRGFVGLTAVQVGSFRIIFAALFLLIVGFKSLKKISRRQWKFVAITSVFGTFTPAYLFAIAETEVDSSIVAILNSLTPLNTLVLGILAFRNPVSKTSGFGCFCGLGWLFAFGFKRSICSSGAKLLLCCPGGNCNTLLRYKCQFDQKIFIRFEFGKYYDRKLCVFINTGTNHFKYNRYYPKNKF